MVPSGISSGGTFRSGRIGRIRTRLPCRTESRRSAPCWGGLLKGLPLSVVKEEATPDRVVASSYLLGVLPSVLAWCLQQWILQPARLLRVPTREAGPGRSCSCTSRRFSVFGGKSGFCRVIWSLQRWGVFGAMTTKLLSSGTVLGACPSNTLS